MAILSYECYNHKGQPNTFNPLEQAGRMSRKKQSRKKSRKASPTKKNKDTQKNSRSWNWGLLFILVATGALFFQAQGFQLLDWDDNKLISLNAWVQAQSFSDVFRVWDPQPALQGKVLEYFPLRDMGYALIHWGWGLNPRPYHILNLLLFLLNVWLVYRLAFHLLQSRQGAWLTAFLFGLHPIHVEAVVWASALKEQLMALFVLLSCEVFLKYWKQPNWKWGVLTALAGLAAALSKHLGVIAPVLWMLFVLFDPNSKRTEDKATLVKRSWPIGLGLLCSLGIGLLSLQIGKGNLALHSLSKSATTTFPSWVLQPLIQVENLGRLLFPWQLVPMYDPPALKSLANGPYLLAVFGCLVILAGVVWAWRKQATLPAFALGWFLVGVGPFIAVQVSTQMTADRYLFLPSFAFCLFVAMGLMWLEAKKEWLGRSVGVAIGVFFVILAVPYISMWKTPETFWTQFVKRAPLSKHSLAGVASFHLMKGNFAKAVEYNQTYLKHYPLEPTRAADLGVAYMQTRQLNKGKAILQKALKKFPNHAQVQYASGYIFAVGGDPQRASVHFEKALKLEPEMHKAALNLVQTYMQTNRARKAYAMLLRLLKRPIPSQTRRQAMGLLHQIRKVTGWK